MKKINIARIFIFFVSVVALSKFFEAGRLIASENTFTHLSMSIFSLLVFLFTLLVMGYWIYAEEKKKNNLRIKFKLYEWFYNKFAMRKMEK